MQAPKVHMTFPWSPILVNSVRAVQSHFTMGENRSQGGPGSLSPCGVDGGRGWGEAKMRREGTLHPKKGFASPTNYIPSAHQIQLFGLWTLHSCWLPINSGQVGVGEGNACFLCTLSGAVVACLQSL